jgi:hypothetical protein
MKIRNLWVWAKFSLILIVIGFAFSLGTPQAQAKTARIDNDVGIEMYEPCIDNTLVVVSLTFENYVNEAEVEISPGDNFILVSSTSMIYDRNETLQGSLYKKENVDRQNIIKNSNNRYRQHMITLFSNILKEPYLSKEHFRLDRSRCLIYTGNIA